MNRSRLLFLVCSCLLVLPMVLALVLGADPARGRHGGITADAKDKEEDTYDTYLKHLKVFSEVLKLIRDTYVDKPNTDALMAGALEGVTDAMDPFSVYVPPSAVGGYTRAQATGRSRSGLALLKEHGATLVMAVEPGGPADAVGFKVGDLVAKLNGESTRTIPFWQLEEALAGEPGTKVTMEVIRLGVPVSLTFNLKDFAAAAASAVDVDEHGKPATAAAAKHVTLLRIPTFGADTAAHVREALAARGQGGADARLMVDLRGVSGGDPEAAYSVAQLFATGNLGSLMKRQSEAHAFAAEGQPIWHGRLAILIDRGTGGAAEVFAEVLHQRVAADLIGERTLGYAGHRAAADLSNGGRLFFTDAFYTGPDKKPINEALHPDVQVTERSRTFLEKDIPIGELILQRGLHHLLEEKPAEPAKKAA